MAENNSTFNDKKNNIKNDIFTLAVPAGIILLFIIASIFEKDRIYSELEMRLLAEKPEADRESVLNGEFMEQYEVYITDQFPGRDKLVGIKTRLDILFGKKEIGGAYIGKDGYLLEQHLPEDYTDDIEEEKLILLEKLVDTWDADVMIVPTADNVLSSKMPDNAVYYDEEQFLEKVRQRIGDRHYIDVYSVLKEHADEDIYYRTDHHWTSLGAYYGYGAWAQQTYHYQVPYDVNNMTTVSDSFQGTLYSKVPVVDTTDSIKIFPETMQRAVTVTYDLEKTADTLYESSYLDEKNQYGYFLDDNHAFVEIDTDYHTGKSLFVIKDSYANSLIPLLQPHYDKIYVVDLRYYNGRLFKLMEQYGDTDEMDVLVLYNCIHFLEDFKYY
jgi:hypothetical protein